MAIEFSPPNPCQLDIPVAHFIQVVLLPNGSISTCSVVVSTSNGNKLPWATPVTSLVILTSLSNVFGVHLAYIVLLSVTGVEKSYGFSNSSSAYHPANVKPCFLGLKLGLTASSPSATYKLSFASPPLVSNLTKCLAV